MKVYLDNCCYNRIFDDRTNIKNYLERESVLLVMQKAFDSEITIIGSKVLQIEMSMMKDREKRNSISGLYLGLIESEVELNEKVKERAEQIQDISNIKAFDSLHLASAEAGADILLTTDIKFIKACKNLQLGISVQNPIEFVMEVLSHDTDD